MEFEIRCLERCIKVKPQPGNPRDEQAAILRRNGFTLEKVGQALGVTRERARQMVLKFERYERSLWAGQYLCDVLVDLAYPES